MHSTPLLLLYGTYWQYRGGNLGAVTTIKAAEANLPVVSLILVVPVCDNIATAEPETWDEEPVVSSGRTTQAEEYKPGLLGPGLVRNTYTFPIRKAVVGGKKDQVL